MAAPARSDHVALLLGNVLHVWGGLQYANGEEVVLPSDQIWLYDLESGLWTRMGMGGELPPLLSQTCGSLLSGMLYVFGGRDSDTYTNQMYCVDLQDGKYMWKKLSTCAGTPPSPRDRHSCWVYKDRLIYFGGYGWKTVQDINNYKTFTIDETSWVMNGRVLFRFWGWNNEVHVYEPYTATWTEPQIQGRPPEPRASHASAILGSKGYICGGLETQNVDIHCLDLATWTWTQIEPLGPLLPIGRNLHTLTPTSHSTLFLFGGLSISGQVLYDGWEFDTVTREWRERPHPHEDKPRFWHSAVQGMDSDVVVYGGCRDFVLVMDSVMVLRSPSQSHCGDVLVFQSQPYSLTRLCEDCIGKHGSVLQEKMSSLPPKVQRTLHKRMSYFKTEMQEQNGYV
ncbi:kelch domain-containing protein 1-like [Clarias gariepinus]|uniref:kelch domain-containing protein 1-like n=1 Tax=Clarias gariepinus TaxID=13013 RepID=UPI00234D8AA1|nr:kelch domain-containing protein 1-like [Clarias gariepinus]